MGKSVCVGDRIPYKSAVQYRQGYAHRQMYGVCLQYIHYMCQSGCDLYMLTMLWGHAYIHFISRDLASAKQASQQGLLHTTTLCAEMHVLWCVGMHCGALK